MEHGTAARAAHLCARIATLAVLIAPGTAAAMECDEIMALLGRGEPTSAVVQRMVRDRRASAETVRCLVERGAPPEVIATARALLRPEPVVSPAEPAAAEPSPEPIAAPVAPIRVAPTRVAPPPARPMPSPRPLPSPARAPSATTPPHTPPPSSAARLDDYVWQGPPNPAFGETYTDHGVNPFVRTLDDPWSTFAIDVDNGSYTMTRRKLVQGWLPPAAAVRTEEFVNYLPYDYRRPPDDAPFGVDVEMAPTPWRDTWTVRVGVQGKRVLADRRKPVHLTFLVDTSGSMQSPDKLGLVKHALTILTEELEDGDTVAIVAYAGSAGLVLPPTSVSKRSTILTALERLSAGGSTAMGAGIQLAYAQALDAYRDGAVNRVLIASDGDANVGATDHGTLSEMIHGYAQRGITLTTLGFGEGNYRDTTMEQIADDGDGNYYYIDSEREAQRVLVDRMTSTLEVIARDVKIQVEFDPEVVPAYRLIGYENRDVADKDFRNDAVDGGEIGSGHQVTALYEIEWSGGSEPLGEIRLRSEAPGPESPATERTYALAPERLGGAGSRQLRMALAAASFAEVLRASNYAEDITLRDVHRLAVGAARAEYPEDAELVDLIARAIALRGEDAVSRAR